MKNINVTQVNYEALGKQYTTYTKLQDPQKIIDVVKLIIDTAHVNQTKQVTISDAEYRKNNLAQVERWYKEIGSRFYEITED